MLPQRIVAFGGSNLFGFFDPQGGGFIGRLKTYHESKNLDNMVFNLGISGETSTGMLKRLLPEAIVRKPDLIIVATGVNDARRLGSKTEKITTLLAHFKKNVQKIINQAKSLSDVIFLS